MSDIATELRDLFAEKNAEIARLRAAIEAAMVDLKNNQRLQAHRKLQRVLNEEPRT